jgi:hypothetical protein
MSEFPDSALTTLNIIHGSSAWHRSVILPIYVTYSFWVAGIGTYDERSPLARRAGIDLSALEAPLSSLLSSVSLCIKRRFWEVWKVSRNNSLGVFVLGIFVS